MDQTPKGASEKPLSLHAFIEDNQRLFTALGVMAALTAFSRSLPQNDLRNGLEFIYLTLALLLWLELWSRLPGKNTHWRLNLFGYVLNYGILYFILYSIWAHRFAWRGIVQMLLTLGVLTLLVRMGKRASTAGASTPAKESGRWQVPRPVRFFGTFILAVIIGGLLSWPVNRGIDFILKDFTIVENERTDP